MTMRLWQVLLLCCWLGEVSAKPFFPCFPDGRRSNATECEAAGCEWDPPRQSQKPWSWKEPGVPSCWMAIYQTPGYYTESQPFQEPSTFVRRNTPTPFGPGVEELKYVSWWGAEGRLRLRLVPEAGRRGPQEASGQPGVNCDDQHYTADSPSLCCSYSDARNIDVVRNAPTAPRHLLVTLSTSPLVVSLQYVQTTIFLRRGRQSVYGFGEQFHLGLEREFDWSRASALNLDEGPRPDTNNLYSSHPFLLVLDRDKGTAFGIYFHNHFPMDLQFHSNDGGYNKILTFRAIGGEVDFYFFAGPSPAEVVAQYTALVGRPRLPPYWHLGFQLSRYGYRNLTQLREVYSRNRAARIPQDVQVTDIDYMDEKKDFTYDAEGRYKGLPDFVRDVLHASGRKWIPIVDPALGSSEPDYPALKRGLELGAFVLDPRTGKPLQTKVWPGRTYFPDFTGRGAAELWREQLAAFHDLVPFDGVWLDMNDPSNFVDGAIGGCENNSVNYPPYSPVSYTPIFKKTICFDAVHSRGSHAEWHNRYGLLEAKATYQALRAMRKMRERRPAMVSRSTSPGSGAFTAHWNGDAFSDWAGLNYSLVNQLEFGLFGVSMVGADICGFDGASNEELCLRWHQAGAFYSFSRNHNDYIDNKVDQDPAVWSPPTVKAIRRALQLRYQFLPLLYTELWKAEINGSVAVRPLFFEFPRDDAVRNLSSQFLWGSHFMVTPILQPHSTSRPVYFPKGLWYRVDSGRMSGAIGGGRSFSVGVAKDTVGLFVRGGGLVFAQGSGETTLEARQTPLTLFVAADERGSASGRVFLDEGDGFRYRFLFRLSYSVPQGFCAGPSSDTSGTR